MPIPPQMPQPGMPPAMGAPDLGTSTGMPPMGDPSSAGVPDSMATPEQKQQLISLIQEIRKQLGQFHAVQFVNTNKAEQKRNDLLKEVFSELQAAGVDLQDPQSVSDFIAKLRAQSPDLADLFEQAMNQLLTGQAAQTGAAINQNQDPNMPPPGPMPMDMNNGNPDTSQPTQG